MQEKHDYSKECRGGVFIFLLLLCDSYLRSAPFRLNAAKHWIFERAPRRLLLFDLKDDEENSGGAVLIKCVFASCVMPESVLFVSSSVCACVSLGGVYLFVEGRGFHVEGRGYHDEGNFFSIF